MRPRVARWLVSTAVVFAALILIQGLAPKAFAQSLATLTVKFPGISGVHIYVRTSDGVPGTANGQHVGTQEWKNNEAVFSGLAAGNYDVLLVKGGESKIVDDLAVSSDVVLENLVATLTVNFPSISGVHVSVKTNGGTDVDRREWQNNQSVISVLKDSYKVIVVKGAQQNTYTVDCSNGDATLDGIVATLTVNFPGISGVHVSIKTDDNATGFGGGDVDRREWQNGQSVIPVLRGSYDLRLTKGAQNNGYDQIDCSGATCALDNTVATLTVKFPELNGVHVSIKTDDNATGFGGGDVDRREWQNGQSVIPVLRGSYDLRLTKGAQNNGYDQIDCSGATCALENTVATLTVNFPGINGVHISVKTISNEGVDRREWQNNQSVIPVLNGSYNVVVSKDGQDYLWNAVDCSGATCTLDKSTLTVKFLGIANVHTYLRKSDGVAGVANGPKVAEQTYKNDEAIFAGLATGLYDISVVKGAQTKIIDNVIVLGNSPVLQDIVATLTVNFLGINNVHTYLKTTADGAVDERTYKTDNAELVVLKAPYKVVVVKGAQQNTYTVDCSQGNCTLDGIVATLTVTFPGINNVHTYLKTTANGAVDERTYKTDKAELVVLKAPYKVVVVKGAQQKTYDVDCSNGDCGSSNIVSNLTLHFPGKSSVHIYLKQDDGTASTVGGAVDERTYQSGKVTLAVFKGSYDIVANIGGTNYIFDAVDCNGDSAVYTLAILTLLNSSGVGIADGDVQQYVSGWKNLGKTSASGILSKAIPGAPASYGFAINYAFGRQEKSQNLNSDIIVVFQTKNVVVELRNSSNILRTNETGSAQYYGGGWRDFGPIGADGTVRKELLPGNYGFAMNYAFGRQEKSQNIGTNPTVAFQTTAVVISLRDSTGASISDGTGTAQYYGGGWRNFGPIGTDGTVRKELLPGNYGFAINYAFGRQEKSQNIGTNPAVTFQTGKVISVGACVGYYGGGWRSFTNGMELLPGNYNFRFSTTPAEQSYSISIGTNNIR